MNIPLQISFAPLRQALVLCAALGVLGACGPTTPSESPSPQTPEATAHLPFDAKEVVRQARAGLGAAQLNSPTVSPELAVNPLPYVSDDREPAVAAGAGLYLIVWTETYAGPPKLVAMRVRASDGTLLDAQPIEIYQSPYWGQRPAIAFDGTNFLVVWEEVTKSTSHIYGVRVRASDGVKLDSTPLHLSRYQAPEWPPQASSMPQRAPSVAFDGTNYLVVWWGGRHREDGSVFYAVNGNRVRPSDGQLVEPYSFAIAETSEQRPHVAYGGGRYLVVWRGGVTGQGNIYGVRIDAASRNILDSVPLSLSSVAGEESNPVVASAGNQFLVVWNAANSALRAARVNAATGAVLAGFMVGESATSSASVTFDGSDYRVSWYGTRDGAQKLFSTQVSTDSQTAAGAELTLSDIHASTSWKESAIAAAEQGRFVVAYHQYDASAGWLRVKMRLVGATPTEEPCSEGQPTLVITGDPELTLECGTGTYSDLGAQAWDGCGNPLQVQTYNSGNDPYGPGPLVSAEGTYTVEYVATDALGQTVSALRTVHVDDRTAPTLQLIGPEFMTHTCGSEWENPGVTATDACYANVAETVQITGWVNSWAEGVYTLRYDLTDSGGNSAASVTRTVEVVDCPW